MMRNGVVRGCLAVLVMMAGLTGLGGCQSMASDSRVVANPNAATVYWGGFKW